MLSNRELLGSELKDKIELYSELTGENGWNVPVARVADFISGFEMGREKFRKRGRWISHERSDLGEVLNHCIECSECNVWFSEEYLIRRSYCPNCGAYMVELEERSDKE